MPNQLKHSVQDADNFIFLGFEFDKWYMQLLLRILHFHNNQNFLKYASNQVVHEDLQIMCYEQFKINFVQDNILSFVNTLHRKCKESDFLRVSKNDLEPQIKTLKTELAQGDIESVIKKLGQFLEESGEQGEELLDTQIVISTRFNRLKKKMRHNVITNEEENIEMNKLNSNLLDLLEAAKILE